MSAAAVQSSHPKPVSACPGADAKASPAPAKSTHAVQRALTSSPPEAGTLLVSAPLTVQSGGSPETAVFQKTHARSGDDVILRELVRSVAALKRGDWRPWARVCTQRHEQLTPHHIAAAISMVAYKLPAHLFEAFYQQVDVEKMLKSFFFQAKSARLEDLNKLAHCCDKMGICAEDVFQRFAEIAVLKIRAGEYVPDSLALLAHNFTTRAGAEKTLFASITQASQACMGEFSAKDLGMLAGAFANANLRDEALFRAIGDRATVLLHTRTSPTEVIFTRATHISLLRAFAILHIEHAPLFTAAIRDIGVQIPGLGSKEIALIAWAYGAQHFYNEYLFPTLAREGLKKISDFTIRDTVLCIHGFGKVESIDKETRLLFAELEKILRKQVKQLSTLDIAQIAYGFGGANVEAPELFFEFELELITGAAGRKKIDQIDHEHILQILWAHAKLRAVNSHNRSFFSEALRVFVSKRAEFPAEELAVCLYSFIVIFNCADEMHVPAVPEEVELLRQTLLEIEQREARNKTLLQNHVSQLSLVFLFAELFHPDWFQRKNYPTLHARLEEFDKHGVRPSSEPSSYQFLAHGQLSQMLGRELESEHRVAGTPFSIDTLVLEREGVEVDGRPHWLSSGRPTGPDLLRERILKALGYNLTHFSTDEIIALIKNHASEAAIQDFLRGRLPAHLFAKAATERKESPKS